MRRVTFSRNYTLSLSRTCRCYCKYCAFATHKPHLHEPEEVERLLDDAARRGVKELLVLTGEMPDSNPEVAERLARLGHADFTGYVIWACERALERGMLPHSNLGVLGSGDLERLREVNASMGLMLESVSERLMERCLGEALSAGGDYADLYFEAVTSTSLGIDESLVKSLG